MKIALCIGNLASKGRQGSDAYKIGHQHIKSNLIDKFKNIDIFLHSYEIELENELIDLYKPIKNKFENKPDFNDKYKNLDTKYCNAGNPQTLTYPNLFSMAYSRYCVGKLKSEYELENGFVYDWVIFVRYDISSAPHIEGITFDENLNNSFIYSSMFNQLNAGPQDQWFYSNSKNMDIIFSLYDNLEEYFKTDSDFVLSANNDWIDSNINDRLSCELLLPKDKKNNIGEKIPLGYISNGHLIYKWHLYINNLWNLENLKFILSKYNISQGHPINKHDNIINL